MQHLVDVAAAIAEGTPIDWASVESSVSSPAEREILAQLRILATVEAAARRTVADEPPGVEAAADGERTSRDDTATVAVDAEPAPTIWRHLTLVEVAGRGGFGTVYRALDPKLDKTVALKLIPAVAQLREAEVLGEARRLARVRHPNVATIHGADFEQGHLGLWMEFVRGRTLRQIVEQRGPFGPDEALLIGIEVARALAAVHGAGVVHRDVKAQNVMREDGGRLVLMDFGAGDDTFGSTRPGTAGTPVYMAPEILYGGRATPQSDIYSLGVLLFYLVTGRHPIAETTWAGAQDAHRTGRRILLRDLRPDLPADFVRSVERLIAPAVGDRIQTAGAAEALLQQTLVTKPRRWAWAGVAAAAVVLAVVLGARAESWPRWFSREAPLRHVAVLPMANLSGDSGHDYFVDGMTDQLIADLSRLGDLRVTDRTSVMGYKDSGKRLNEIAKELGVEAVLESSMMLAGTDMHLTAALIRARDGLRLWSKSYDRAVRDAFAVQAEMARDLAASVFAAPPGTQPAAPQPAAHAPSPEAFDLNLKAQAMIYGGRRDQVREACAMFERATAIDPAYAVAWTGLARCQLILEAQGLESNDGAARATALHALSLDPSMAEAHLIVADAKFLGDRDWSGAHASYTEAVRLNPSLAQARATFARFLAAAGRTDEAVHQARLGVEVNPLAPDARQTLALMLYYARGYPEALSHASDTLTLNPAYPATLVVRARTLAELRQYDEALATLRRLRERADTPAATAEAGRVMALMGRTDEAIATLDALPAAIGNDGVVQFEDRAFILIALGRHDEALALLQRAVDQRSSRMLWLRVDPRVDPIRGDPRFQALLAGIGGLE